MRGLFEKDLRLVLQRKKIILMFIICMAAICYGMDPSFIIGYGCIIFGILGIGTLSYDEFDNCIPFLLTLPNTRKDFVKEKFIFCLFCVALGWIVSILCGLLVSAISGNLADFNTGWLERLALLPVFSAAIMIAFPLQLKYGSEKSRLILFLICGIIAVFVVFTMKSATKGGGGGTGIFNAIEALPDVAVFVGIMLISLAFLAGLYIASCKVFENKTF